MKKKFGIYLITPDRINLQKFKEDFRAVLNTGCISYAQLRLKECDDNFIIECARTLLKISNYYNVPFLINDRPDIAKITGANGVHLGQKDSSPSLARKVLGNKSIIGVSCHNSIDLACNAVNMGADYVAFGGFFKSISKEVQFSAEISILEWWKKISPTPSIAIGGINKNNFKNLLTNGADHIAVISSVWSHPISPVFAINEYAREISKI